MSDSLRPHESQQARPPCPSPTPGVHSKLEVTHPQKLAEPVLRKRLWASLPAALHLLQASLVSSSLVSSGDVPGCPDENYNQLRKTLVKNPACNAGNPGSIPGLGRSPGEGKGYPLQSSGLENCMICTVHGVGLQRAGHDWATFTFCYFQNRIPSFVMTGT